MELVFNDYQTKLADLAIDKLPDEIKEQFYDFINNVPFIKTLISPERKRACDLPRDEEGKIIIDVTKPHILEDMDYFRPTALHYKKTGRMTDLRPNANPNSEYGKWIREEVRRCYEGYVRESDGEWITGDYYFFLNYCPMLISRKSNGKKADRVIDFPSVWDGHYLKFHYINQAREHGHHGCELASRGKGKSYSGAALLAKRFILGESYSVNKNVQSVVTASEKKYLSGANQILDMFKTYIDFSAQNTQFPSKRLIDSKQGLQWRMGYTDLDTGTDKGTLNSVIGITSKDDESKLRGSRGVLYLIEEMGTFPRLLNLYNVLRPSVEEGENTFGLIYMYGTAGDNESDFASAQEIMYNPKGYNMEPLENVYDITGQGRPSFVYFFPGYLNRANCYDDNGNSDVIKAILEILRDRYIVKYNSTDINSIVRRIAEIPITPQEAILRSRGNLFPVTDLNERLNELETNEKIFDDVYIGELYSKETGEVKFRPTADIPIRYYPLKDSTEKGALEIFAMPEKGPNGTIPYNRYIIGHDPVDNDQADSLSLTSTFVLDLWTDRIVAEYTGRQNFADDNFEIVRKLCIFYNAKVLYESNKKGLFAYFSKMNSTHLLADTPEYLRDKQLIKYSNFGSNAKGVNATKAVNVYADSLTRDWLLQPVPTIKHTDDGDEEVVVKNLFFLKNKALIHELIQYNPAGNFDRIRAFGMLMLYREEFMILYGGDKQGSKKQEYDDTYLGNNEFFTKNYDNRFK